MTNPEPVLPQHATPAEVIINSVNWLFEPYWSGDRLTAILARKGRNVAALHGGLSQRERDKTLADFRSGKIQFLIATNVASRGLDITDLPFVLNYDIPEDADTYVHRVGRTARAGREGTAITLVGEWDLDAWEQIRKEVGVEVEEGELKLYNRS